MASFFCTERIPFFALESMSSNFCPSVILEAKISRNYLHCPHFILSTPGFPKRDSFCHQAWPWGINSAEVAENRKSIEEVRESIGTEVEVNEGKSSLENAQLEISSSSLWLPESPTAKRPQSTHNAATLAYLGDAIYELYARRHFLIPPQSVDKYSRKVTAVVCCEAQDELVRKLQETKFLTAEERNVLRWGRNTPRGARRANRRAGNAVYSGASSLETLVGYLYLTDPVRLDALMCKIGFTVDGKDFILNSQKTSTQQEVVQRTM